MSDLSRDEDDPLSEVEDERRRRQFEEDLPTLPELLQRNRRARWRRVIWRGVYLATKWGVVVATLLKVWF